MIVLKLSDEEAAQVLHALRFASVPSSPFEEGPALRKLIATEQLIDKLVDKLEKQIDSGGEPDEEDEEEEP